VAASYEGIFPILHTPFDDHGEIDEPGQLALVDFVIASGANGLGLFANASEGYALTDAEKARLLPLILAHVRRRVPAFVSTGHTGTHAAVALARAAEEAGADGLLVLPPYYLKPSGEDLLDYFRAIASVVSIPLMIQDAPLWTAVPIGAGLMARLAQECEQVRYVKVEAPPTPPKITEVRQAAGDLLTQFGGLNGLYLLEEFHRGARGNMPGCDLTDRFVRIWDLWRLGQTVEARAEFNRSLPLIRYEMQPAIGVSIMKHHLKALGVLRSAVVRPPARALDPEGLEELQALCGGA
jgi:4-hydroxy-tetrahydrodipicolinate synthase